MNATDFNPRQRLIISLAVMSATIMQAIDTTIANVALPNMQASMGVFQDQISWVLTSYILAAAICMPLTGFLAARLGRKRLFVACVVGFTLTSMLCGAAQSLSQIVAFRFLQGVFGAALVPLSQAIMMSVFPIEQRGKAMALWGMGVMIGPAVGPLVGGWLTEEFSWRWVFYINAPIGFITVIGLLLYLPETPKEQRRFDVLGFVFFSLAIGALQMMLDRGESLHWFAHWEIVLEAICAVTFFYLFVVHTLTGKDTYITPVIFKDRNFIIGLTLIFLVGVILLAVMALMPPLMQGIMGYPIFDVGYLLAPRGLGTMLSMLLVGRIINSIDPRLIMFTGLSLMAFSLWQMVGFSVELTPSEVVWSGFIQGLGLGCMFVPLSTVTFATMDPKHHNDGTSLYNLVRNLGSSIGVSIVVTLLAQNSQANHEALAAHITATNINLWPLLERDSQLGLLNDGVAMALIDAEVSRQAAILSYLQDFQLVMWMTLAVMPLLLLIRTPKLQAAT